MTAMSPTTAPDEEEVSLRDRGCKHGQQDNYKTTKIGCNINISAVNYFLDVNLVIWNDV